MKSQWGIRIGRRRAVIDIVRPSFSPERRIGSKRGWKKAATGVSRL